MWNIFENCWLLLTLAGITLIAASIIRQEKPQWGFKPLLVPLLLLIFAFGLDYLVTTDHEAVRSIVPACRRACIAENPNAIMQHISPNYSDSAHKDRDSFRNAVERVIPHASIKKVRIQSHVITIQKNTAESELAAAVHFNTDTRYTEAGSLVFVEMEFQYEKIGEMWYIQRIEVTSVNYQPMDWNEAL